jgi:hypothetical protein
MREDLWSVHDLGRPNRTPGAEVDGELSASRRQFRLLPNYASSFQEGMIEKRPITFMGRTTDVTVAMLLRVRAHVEGNHNRVHASLKSSRGPRCMSLAGSP